MFRYAYPWLFLLLLFLPLVWLWRKRFTPPALIFPLQSKFSQDLVVKSSWRRLPSFLIYFCLASLIFAVARPQAGEKKTEVMSEGVDIVLAIDTSLSMAALDFNLEGRAVDRLTVVKKVVTDFIRGQKSDRIGMVIFGEEAYTQSPLTLDYEVLIQLLDQVKIGIAGNGTAIGDGLGLSVKRLKDLPGKTKIVILLTDGVNNSGKISPETAANLAKSLGVKVYTIGIGTKGPVPFPVKDVFGTRIVQQEIDVDPEALQKIAQETGGKYFFATDTRGLEEIYKDISKLEKTKVQVKNYELYQELYRYLVYLGLGLLSIEILLSATRLRRLV